MQICAITLEESAEPNGPQTLSPSDSTPGVCQAGMHTHSHKNNKFNRAHSSIDSDSSKWESAQMPQSAILSSGSRGNPPPHAMTEPKLFSVPLGKRWTQDTHLHMIPAVYVHGLRGQANGNSWEESVMRKRGKNLSGEGHVYLFTWVLGPQMHLR